MCGILSNGVFDKTECEARMKLRGRDWVVPGAVIRTEAVRRSQTEHRGAQHKGLREAQCVQRENGEGMRGRQLCGAEYLSML